MYWRAHQITKAIQGYDSMLYAKKGYQDRIDIFRKTFRYEPYEVDGTTIHHLIEEPYRVFCLTDTWNASGRPVEWGVEPILAKLRASDLWKRDIGSEIHAHNEKIDASMDRSMKNNIEAFVKDTRRN